MEQPEVTEVVAPVVPAATGGYGSFTVDDMTVESSSSTSDELREAFTPPADEKKADAKVEETAERNTDGTFKAKTEKPRNNPQARIDQIVREREEARREAAALKAELAAARAPKVEAPKPAVVADDPEPKQDDFDDYSKYVKAQARWEVRQELNEQAKKTHEAQQQAESRRALHEQEQAYFKTAETFVERWEAAKQTDPDFVERIAPSLLSAKALSAMTPAERAQGTTLANFLADQIMQSEHPKEVALYLSDPKNSQRLATLHPNQIIRELAKVEARLDAATPTGSAPKAKPVTSQASAPITPVKGSSHVADSDDLSDDLSVDEFIRRGNALERRQKAGR